jgi:tetratricopeptide (TPR) repeat protein
MGARVRRLVILSTVGVLAILQPNRASAASDADHCSNANPDVSIAYCTVIIETEISNLLVLGSAYSNRGLAYARKGQYGAALKDYVQAMKYRPDYAIPYNNRCYALAQLGKLDDALADCQMAIKLDPRNPEVLDSRAFVYVLLGRYPEAIRDYDAALGISPRMVFSLFGRAVAKLKSGNGAGATADFAAAKAVDPDVAKKMAASGLIVDVVDGAPRVRTSVPVSPR